MPPLTLLLINDDVELGARMRDVFEGYGVVLETVHDEVRGLERALGGDHDLVLLDIMMPGLHGLDLLRRLRHRSRVPVIMLTAGTALAECVAVLDAGADDYLPKPFDLEELLARVRALLRRSGRACGPGVLDAGGLSLNPATREVRCLGEVVDVTAFEFDLMECLVRSADRIVSRAELTAILYRRNFSPSDRALDIHVHHLRKKLGQHGRSIRTVRGVGYQFIPGGP